jgi:hypothetical protein
VPENGFDGVLSKLMTARQRIFVETCHYVLCGFPLACNFTEAHSAATHLGAVFHSLGKYLQLQCHLGQTGPAGSALKSWPSRRSSGPTPAFVGPALAAAAAKGVVTGT